MKLTPTRPLALGATLGALLALGACSDDTSMTADAGTTADAGGTATLYDRLGGQAGITTVINAFVGKVLADPKINGYFLNNTLNATRLVTCLVKQVGSLTGGPQTYPTGTAPADADGCRNMKASHAGLKISTNDWNDLAGHLLTALEEAGVAAGDRMVIAQALEPLKPDIIEDPGSNGTVYQRVGRKPAIATVVTDFVGRVVADQTLVGFFGTTNAARLELCLVRQVCGIDGPCVYGQEVEDAVKVGNAIVACKDMASSHAGLMNGARGIRKADFDALVMHLVAAMTQAGVTETDRGAVLGALGPLCPQIVAPGESCN